MRPDLRDRIRTNLLTPHLHPITDTTSGATLAVLPGSSRGGAWVGMTGRLGGVSEPPYDSLDLGYHVGDDAEKVRENRGRLARSLRLPGGCAVVAEQVHGTRVAVVEPRDAGRGWLDPSTAIPQTDALVTVHKGLALGILVADCFPVAVWDGEWALGVAHCGWRGVAAGLPERMLQVMIEELGAEPERCNCWIGAGIGPCCFQVGGEVMDQLPGAPARRDDEGRWRLDLPALIRQRLQASGVRGGAEKESGVCTACSETHFFSHRRATRAGQSATGRQMLFAWMG